jgi:hypothetical protein
VLKKVYLRDVVGERGSKSFTMKDENYFRMASIKVKDFFKQNEGRVCTHIGLNDQELGRWLWESIKNGFSGGDDFSIVRPSWLVSKNTFEHRLPAYLYFQNIFMEVDNEDADKEELEKKKKKSTPLYKSMGEHVPLEY